MWTCNRLDFANTRVSTGGYAQKSPRSLGNKDAWEGGFVTRGAACKLSLGIRDHPVS